jgi:ABC-type multidrug transport system ATPase subunit
MLFRLELENIGKKYYNRWLFRRLDVKLQSGDRLALTGPNGSGKSTLLKVIAGQTEATEGRVIMEAEAGNPVNPESYYRYLSWSGPYIDLFDDLSLSEHISLHFRFRECLLKDPFEMVQILDLEAHQSKPLRYYSSGMLQRVKVGLALFTRSKLLLLDEPTSNMDGENAARMLDLIHRHSADRIFILASNMEREFADFSNVIRLARA